MPPPLHLKYLPKFALGLLLMAANDIRRRRFHRLLAAYWDALRNVPYLLRERRRVQATRRVPVSYIDSILVHPLPPTQKRLLRIRDALTIPSSRRAAPRRGAA
jgi:hypothetical protein